MTKVTFTLQEILKERNLSTADFARSTGMRYQTLRSVLQGREGLAFKTLAKFCVALQVAPGDLLVLEGATARRRFPAPAATGKKRARKLNFD